MEEQSPEEILYPAELQAEQRKELESFTTEDLRDILTETCADPVLFCRTFLRHKFGKPMPWVHRGILAIATRQTDFLLKYGELNKIIKHFVWQEDSNDPDSPQHPIFHPRHNEAGEVIALDLDYTKYSLLMMPRGFSKTTLLGQAVILFYILFELKRFIVYLSETAGHAEMQVNNIKAELESNEIIRAVFGNIVPDRYDRRKWTAKTFETLTDVVVACRGRGGQVRGLNHKGFRPDCILFDDVEDKESVKTEEQRGKTLDWMYSDVMPALPEMNDEATIIGLGTLLHQEALLMTLIRDPEWTSMVFAAIDRDGDPLWEDNMSLEKLERKKQSYAMAGKLAAFYMEYMSVLRHDGAQKFKKSFFLIDPFIREELVTRALVIDPAISEEDTSDFCGFGVVGMSEKGRLGVLEAYGERGMTPREQIDKFFELSALHQVDLHGVESIAYQKALVHLIREEMYRKHRYFEIDCISHGKTGKDERILGVLQPRYANNYIIHARRFTLLETQLLDYPKGKKDLPDVIAMAITLLDPYAAMAADPERDLGDDEAPPLCEVLEGEWRSH